MYSLVLRNRFTGIPIQFSWSLSLHSFLLVSTVSHKFQLPQCPWTPFSQFHETAVLCQDFPTPSYRLKSVPWGKIRVIVGPTLFLFSQGSPFCAAYYPLSENSCFIFFYLFPSRGKVRKSYSIMVRSRNFSNSPNYKSHHFQT